MTRVVPSQVVDLIDKLFPTAKAEQPGNPIRLNFDSLAAVTPLVRLLEQIPSELLVMNATQYAEYVSSVAALNSHIRVWETRGNTQPLMLIPGLRRQSPIALIRQALDSCHDEFPSPGTAELGFVTDAPLRESLRLDISATNQALANAEWKAATVLAGSIIEALLLWALQQRPSTEVTSALGKIGRKLDSDIQKWNLVDYIDVGEFLGVIKAETVTQCRLAKNFRNLIHPGRVLRLGHPCNRGTALSAVAAVEHVINDLTP